MVSLSNHDSFLGSPYKFKTQYESNLRNNSQASGHPGIL